MADESSEVMLDINSLETEAARLLIPFLRTASLMKHYIYKENLPEMIWLMLMRHLCLDSLMRNYAQMSLKRFINNM